MQMKIKRHPPQILDQQSLRLQFRVPDMSLAFRGPSHERGCVETATGV
jgi:hypothetical protein